MGAYIIKVISFVLPGRKKKDLNLSLADLNLPSKKLFFPSGPIALD